LTRTTTLAALAGVTAISLMVPVAAQATTKTVYEGLPVKAQKQFLAVPYEADAIDFFPHTVTINVGDSVKFVPTAFHNVDIPARGKKPIPLLLTGPPVSGAVDAAGAPYWFNGLPTVKFNPKMVPPNTHVDFSPTKQAAGKAKKVTYTGAKEVLSPIPFNAGPKPLTVKFTKAGTVTYYCPLHTGMTGKVRVLPKSRAIPSAKADAKALKAQIDRDFKVAKTLSSTPPTPGVVHVGYAGDHGVEYFGFLPKTTTVPVGTTLTFQMTPKSIENHTATTGPGNPTVDLDTYLGKIAASFFAPQFDPAGVYPSEPSAPTALTPTSHGNGFWNSGVLDSLPSALLPPSRAVTFAAAGTYQFWCMVHPQMHGTVVVQ
jgi:plastocyanin